VKLSAQEEYGLRCLLQVARRAPGPESEPTSIRDVADAEGLSVDYAAKLLRILRQGELIDSERGCGGGYRMARPAGSVTVAEALSVLDTPLYSAEFCEGHAGQRECCVHRGKCVISPVWRAVEAAVNQVLAGVTLSDLLATPTNSARAGSDPARPINEPAAELEGASRGK
jgi:Rrf2 family protein